MENVVQYTEYMFREYYHLNTEPFFSVLDTDVMWIGPGNIFVFGKIALKSYFKDGSLCRVSTWKILNFIRFRQEGTAAL